MWWLGLTGAVVVYLICAKLNDIYVEVRSIRRMMNSDRDIDWSDELPKRR